VGGIQDFYWPKRAGTGRELAGVASGVGVRRASNQIEKQGISHAKALILRSI